MPKKKLKVLVIEDDRTMSSRISAMLQKEGFEVFQEHDGQAGFETVLEKKPDLILLDIMLPELDGYSVCRLVRKEPSSAQIPIIMLSARGMEADKIVGLEGGADDYITKPFSLRELIARIQAVLRRVDRSNPFIAQGAELSCGNLRVNIDSRVATKDGVALKLTKIEFDLLVELIRNQGVVISRGLIMNQVWGSDYLIDSRTVDVHIRLLREKIEEEPSRPTRITTVKGIGYRFQC
jgi:DNA-binding response OmpR family regulator